MVSAFKCIEANSMNTKILPIKSILDKESLLKYVLGTLILLVFAVFIEYFIGWFKLLQPWKGLDTLSLVAVVPTILITYCLRALRIYDFFHHEMQGRFTLCLRLSLQHNMLNNLLPMRTGELSFPWLMSRYFSITATRSVPVLLWFRLLDIHTLIILALLIAGTYFLPLWACIVSTLLWLPLPWLIFRFYRPLLNSISQHQGKLWYIFQTILESLPQDYAMFWRTWMWTALNWILKLVVFAWVLMLFGGIEFVAAWIGATTGDISSILPINSIANVGTFEAGVVAGLVPFDIAATDALIAAINLHLFVLSCTMISGILSRSLPKSHH
jgi:hypothetical protein